MTPKDVANMVWEEVEKIRAEIPPKHTLQIIRYEIPHKLYQVLLEDELFSKMVKKDQPNLGGYLVEPYDSDTITVHHMFIPSNPKT